MYQPAYVILLDICTKTTFRCTPESDVCLENELICDGYNDCPNGFDEDIKSCVLATFSNSCNITYFQPSSNYKLFSSQFLFRTSPFLLSFRNKERTNASMHGSCD